MNLSLPHHLRPSFSQGLLLFIVISGSAPNPGPWLGFWGTCIHMQSQASSRLATSYRRGITFVGVPPANILESVARVPSPAASCHSKHIKGPPLHASAHFVRCTFECSCVDLHVRACSHVHIHAWREYMRMYASASAPGYALCVCEKEGGEARAGAQMKMQRCTHAHM